MFHLPPAPLHGGLASASGASASQAVRGGAYRTLHYAAAMVSTHETTAYGRSIPIQGESA